MLFNKSVSKSHTQTLPHVPMISLQPPVQVPEGAYVEVAMILLVKASKILPKKELHRRFLVIDIYIYIRISVIFLYLLLCLGTM